MTRLVMAAVTVAGLAVAAALWFVALILLQVGVAALVDLSW